MCGRESETAFTYYYTRAQQRESLAALTACLLRLTRHPSIPLSAIRLAALGSRRRYFYPGDTRERSRRFKILMAQQLCSFFGAGLRSSEREIG